LAHSKRVWHALASSAQRPASQAALEKNKRRQVATKQKIVVGKSGSGRKAAESAMEAEEAANKVDSSRNGRDGRWSVEMAEVGFGCGAESDSGRAHTGFGFSFGFRFGFVFGWGVGSGSSGGMD
jgi:hypothetical protein